MVNSRARLQATTWYHFNAAPLSRLSPFDDLFAFGWVEQVAASPFQPRTNNPQRPTRSTYAGLCMSFAADLNIATEVLSVCCRTQSSYVQRTCQAL